MYTFWHVLLEKFCFTVRLYIWYVSNFVLSSLIKTGSSLKWKKKTYSKISSEEVALAYPH